MSSIPQATRPINLGCTFFVTFRVPVMGEIGRDLERTRREAQRAGFVLDGDWPGAVRYFKTFAARLEISQDRANRQVAVMYFEDVRSAWNTQSLAPMWAPLSTAYIASKIRAKLDRRTLVATKEALESMGYNHLPGIAVEVGVQAVAEDGTPYMMSQEFGSITRRIPARALFGPILEEHVGRYVDVYDNALRHVLAGGVYPDYSRGALA